MEREKQAAIEKKKKEEKLKKMNTGEKKVSVLNITSLD